MDIDSKDIMSAKASEKMLTDAVSSLGPKQRREYMKTLRTSWVKFLADPDAYIAALRNDASRWGVKEVRKHLLDRKFGLAPNKAWRATAFQLHQIVISDVLFLCGAFHRVVPRKHLSRAESKEHLFEKFRNGDRHDPQRRPARKEGEEEGEEVR